MSSHQELFFFLKEFRLYLEFSTEPLFLKVQTQEPLICQVEPFKRNLRTFNNFIRNLLREIL